jgi:hypothetical protein
MATLDIEGRYPRHDSGSWTEQGAGGPGDDGAVALVPGAGDPAQAAMLFRSTEPAEIVRQASAVAQALAPVIAAQRLYTDINGRRHVRVEGWTLLGSMLGVFPVCVWSRPIPADPLAAEASAPLGWEVRVEARTLGGALVGAAEACCTRDEPNWRDRPDYALRSMCQTRATSKALRLPLGFVVALAGYEPTPAEEIDGATYRGRAPGNGRPPEPRRAGGVSEPHGAAQPLLPVTEAQLRAIHAIAQSLHAMDEAGVDALCRRRYGAAPAALSRRQASELIDAMKRRARG